MKKLAIGLGIISTLLFAGTAHAMVVTPTLYCLGSCPEVPEATVTPDMQKVQNTSPGIRNVSNYNTANSGQNQRTNTTTADPCTASVQDSTQHHDHGKSRKSSGGGMLQKFIEFLFKFIQMLFEKLGIQLPEGFNLDPEEPENPNPENPDGEDPDNPDPDNPEPTKAPDGTEPTTQPAPCEPTEAPDGTAPTSEPTISSAIPTISGATTPGVTGTPGGGSPTTATCGSTANTPSSPVTGYTIAQCEDFNGSDTGAFDGYDGGGGSTVVGGGRKKAQCTGGGGMLTLTQTADGSTCGGTMGSFAQKYGYWEVKMRAYATGSGGSAPHPVLILWPDTDVWNDGELDFVETNIGEDGIEVFLHCVGNAADNCYNSSHKTDITQWHVYGFEWTAAGFKGYIDGKEIYTTDGKGSNPSVSMHQTIQLDNLTGKTPVTPSKMEIDWVHMYKK